MRIRLRTNLLSVVTVTLVWTFCSFASLELHGEDRFTERISRVLQTQCLKCHGGSDEVEGEVDLSAVTTEADLIKQPELLQKLVDVIELSEMPPEDEPQLDEEQRNELLEVLRPMLHSAASKSGFARTPIRRMNRFQYNNAVTDLLDLKVIVFTLPERMMREHRNYFKPETGKMADQVTVGSRPLGKSQMIEPRLAGVAAFPQDLRAEHGYDNRGDHLSLSPLLMESFLKLGQSITQSPDFMPKNVGVWKSFFAKPDNVGEDDLGDGVSVETEVRSRLQPFLRRAFRRPVEGELLDRYVRFATRQIEHGVSFPDAMKSVVAATIASPKFLYLYDHADSENDEAFELASRLSFFLWGSIPDQTLLDLAAAGELMKPNVLDVQVDRMLKDQKLKRFCDSFPSQWLQLERIISAIPNREKFPDFFFLKYLDSMHMMMEPLLLFETVLIENQPITQFIDSDFTYRSRMLEEAYGELGNPAADGKKAGTPVTVIKFDRVPVPDRRSGGLITNAAVMTMTSGPDRTQPITRGAWLAGVIFNDPPEPPPADVPPLDEHSAGDEEKLTLRERLAMHRERSDCKGCHEQIDPLGFALENYNPIGVWRSEYKNGREVDMAGKLFRKHAFGDITEFKDAILAEKDRFTRGLAGHLLSYALARELGTGDQPALDVIVQATAADEYKIQTLLKQVIQSEPFRSSNRPR